MPSLDDLRRLNYERLLLAKQSVGGQISATGVLVSPSAGRRLEVYWVYALTDPDNATSPLITFTLGAQVLYCGYAISHREVFTGGVDEALAVTLSEPAPVAVTVHYKEI